MYCILLNRTIGSCRPRDVETMCSRRKRKPTIMRTKIRTNASFPTPPKKKRTIASVYCIHISLKYSLNCILVLCPLPRRVNKHTVNIWVRLNQMWQKRNLFAVSLAWCMDMVCGEL